MGNYIEIEVTPGNLQYDHLYLRGAIAKELFPADAIGGPNKESVGIAVEVHCGIGEPVRTDIAGDKKIFRRRAWVREFFATHGIEAGDRIVIERTAPRRFHVYPVRGPTATVGRRE